MDLRDPAAADGPMTFDDTYADEQIGLTRLAYLVVGSRAVAEEIVHEAFTALLRRWDDVEQPGAYLRTSVVRAAVRAKRRTQREVALSRSAFERPRDDTDASADVESMWAALAVLPARQRAALVLRFYEDCSHDEIAAAMRTTPANARVLVHRGLARLRKDVDTWMTE